MTEDPSRRVRPLVLPQLRYDRPVEAIEWLSRVFGFTEELRLSGPNGELAISSLVSPGGGTVMICGAQILVPPRDQPWGLRDYEVLDLEGRQWNFSQHLTEVAPDDWGASAVS